MRLLLDENTADRRFVAALRHAGHDVETSILALGAGASDVAIFAYARDAGRVVVTRDCADFQSLVAERPDHTGLLLIFAGRIVSSMSLVRAVARIDDMYPSMSGLVLSLVEFSW